MLGKSSTVFNPFTHILLAFIKIDERYADRAVQSLNNCFFFGAQIKVQFSKQNDNQRHSDSRHSDRQVSFFSDLWRHLYYYYVIRLKLAFCSTCPLVCLGSTWIRGILIATIVIANHLASWLMIFPSWGFNLYKTLQMINWTIFYSGQRPSCPLPRRDEIEQLVTRRKRLEVGFFFLKSFLRNSLQFASNWSYFWKLVSNQKSKVSTTLVASINY